MKSFYDTLCLSLSLFLKVTFSPLVIGTYKGIVQLFSSLSGSLLATVSLLATAANPHLQFLTSSDGKGGRGEEVNKRLVIDFGTCISGRDFILPLYIVNHGETTVPIRLTLATVSIKGEREGKYSITHTLSLSLLSCSPHSTGTVIQWPPLVML